MKKLISSIIAIVFALNVSAFSEEKLTIEKQLVGDYNCNKESEVVLLKRIDNRELYEINCIREIKRMIFDCSPNGCEVLQ